MKYGQQRLAAGRKNFIFFLCPLDGEQFNLISCSVAAGYLILYGSDGFAKWLVIKYFPKAILCREKTNAE